MATKTSNAVGAFRQFSPNPQDTYQKRLIVASGNTSAGAGSKAAKLAQALGVLSDTILNEIPRQNARDKKYGKFMAETVKDNPDNAGKVVMTTQQMLANAGHQELLDNPYTMAALDKYRGENAMRDIRNRYEEDIVGKSGYCSDSTSEQKRWNDFVHSHMNEYNVADSYKEATMTSQVTGDSAPASSASIGTVQPTSSFENPNKEKFFNIGFYDNYDTYTQNVLNAQANEAAKNRKVIRDGSFNAKLSDYFSPEYTGSHSFEEVASNVKTAMDEYHLSGGALYDSIPIISKNIDGYIANNGSKNLSELFKIKAYTGVGGEEYTLKDILPFESFHGEAIQMDAARNEEYMSKIIKDIGNCTTVDAMENKIKALRESKDDNERHIFAVLSKNGLIRSMLSDKKREVEWNNRARSSGTSGVIGKAVKSSIQNAFYARGDEWARQYLANNSWGNNAPITAPIQMPELQPDGNVTYRKATDDEVANLGQYLIYNIMSDFQKGNIALSDAVNKEAKLMTAPQLKAFKSSFNTALTNTLIQSGNIDWENATYDGTNLQNMQMALDIYNQNPSMAKAVLDADNFKEIERIAALTEITDGISYSSQEAFDGLKRGMQEYGKVRELLQNTDTANDIEYKYNTIANDPTYTSMEVDTMETQENGDPIMGELSYTTDDYLKSRIKNLASVYIAAGSDGESAVKLAMNTVRGQVFKYSEMGYNVVIPKDFCSNINESPNWQGVAARHAMQAIIYDVKGDSDGYVDVKYDYLTNRLIFMNTETHTIHTYTSDEFANEANYLLSSTDENTWNPPKSRWVTDEEFEDNPTEKYSVINY